VALVTGAASGIGRAIAVRLAAEGACVVVADLDLDRAQEVATEIGSPDMAVGVAADVTDPVAVQAAVDAAVLAFGGIDLVVNNAGLSISKPLLETTEEDWDLQHDVNLKACFFLNRAAAQLMREQGRGGRLVNFTSQGWWTGGFGGSVVYAASKGGVVSMSRGLARTLAPDGITVNTVSPGAADTSMMRSGMTEEGLAEFVKMIPLGRMAEPAEVASSVLFLASDLGRYISGATINVSGGQLMY
jgi:NAD(P)-dependent dehydrogenase (short-subunit alcohol dehydrogenase family)